VHAQLSKLHGLQQSRPPPSIARTHRDGALRGRPLAQLGHADGRRERGVDARVGGPLCWEGVQVGHVFLPCAAHLLKQPRQKLCWQGACRVAAGGGGGQDILCDGAGTKPGRCGGLP